MKRNRASHSGAQGAKGVEGVRKGTGKDRGGEVEEEVGESTGRKGCWDTSHYNINEKPGMEHRVWDVPAPAVRNLRRRMMGRWRGEETSSGEETMR